jgi:hypothetical protein
LLADTDRVANDGVLSLLATPLRVPKKDAEGVKAPTEGVPAAPLPERPGEEEAPGEAVG